MLFVIVVLQMKNKSQAQLTHKKFFFSITPGKIIFPFVMNLAKLSLWYPLFMRSSIKKMGHMGICVVKIRYIYR